MNNGVRGKLESYIKFKYVGVGWSEDILSVQYVYIILVTYMGRDAGGSVRPMLVHNVIDFELSGRLMSIDFNYSLFLSYSIESILFQLNSSDCGPFIQLL